MLPRCWWYRPVLRTTNKAHGLMSTILLDDNFATGGAFGASGTPSAVKVGRDGAITAPLVVGGPAVMGLLTGQPVAGAAQAAPALPAVRVGEQAPDFSLPDLDGKSISLAGFRGKETMLLFWNPGCGFCQQMLQDLRTWEVQKPAGTPEILIVSTGAAQENRVMGLRSPMVLDSSMSVGQQLGAMGTPMAVLIDAQGRVASSPPRAPRRCWRWPAEARGFGESDAGFGGLSRISQNLLQPRSAS